MGLVSVVVSFIRLHCGTLGTHDEWPVCCTNAVQSLIMISVENIANKQTCIQGEYSLLHYILMNNACVSVCLWHEDALFA